MFLRSTRIIERRHLNPFTLKSNKCLPQRLLQNRELSIKSAEQLPPVGQSVKSTQQNHLSPAESVSVFGGVVAIAGFYTLIETNSVFISRFCLCRQKTRSPTHLDEFTHIYAFR